MNTNTINMIKDDYVYGTRSKTRRFLSKISHSVTGPKKVYEYLTKKIPSKPSFISGNKVGSLVWI